MAYQLIRKTAQGVVYRWIKNRNVTMLAGIGAGLKFNAGNANPAYALGTNERPVQKSLAKHLKSGDVFYDIGANAGFFTVLGAKLVGSGGHVYAFEPVPDNIAVVRHNISINRFENVTVVEKAVSRRSGTGELILAHYAGGAVLASAGNPPDEKGTITVDLVAIDDLVEERQILPPCVVKIDVEGAELEVLEGMVKTIKQYKPVIIYEIDDGDEASFRQKWESCEIFAKGFGYSVVPLQESYPGIDWIVGHAVATPQ